MLKSLVILFTLLLLGLTWGQTGFATGSSTYACLGCDVPIIPNLPESNEIEMKKIRNYKATSEEFQDIYDANQKLNFARKCDNFIDEDGIGKWGNLILEELQNGSFESLYEGTMDLQRICPNYPKMDNDEKEIVWMMVINAMVHLESSCEKTAPAKGPNGRLIGLLQLHRNHEHLYSRGCRKGDGKTPSGSFRCGLSMLNRQLSQDGALFSRKSYWDVLRPQARSQKFKMVQKAIWNLSICR